MVHCQQVCSSKLWLCSNTVCIVSRVEAQRKHWKSPGRVERPCLVQHGGAWRMCLIGMGTCQRFQEPKISELPAAGSYSLSRKELLCSWQESVTGRCFLLCLLRAGRKGKCFCSLLCAPAIKSPSGQLSVAEIGVGKSRHFCAIRKCFCFVSSIKHPRNQFSEPAGSGWCANSLSSAHRLHSGVIWQDWYFIMNTKKMSIFP